MKIAIMQPYFLPYIGYWQLIAAVDQFVIYDNIKYTKKGWINRNRFLLNGRDELFTLPLKKDSDYLHVVQRELSPDFEKNKLINQLSGAYSRAPYFREVMPLIDQIVRFPERNLFKYIHHSIRQVCNYLLLNTLIKVSSSMPVDHSLTAQDKVLSICQSLGATTYINAIGGQGLYDRDVFLSAGVDLRFIKSNAIEYSQYNDVYVPWLSILAVLMFNPKERVCDWVNRAFSLV